MTSRVVQQVKMTSTSITKSPIEEAIIKVPGRTESCMLTSEAFLLAKAKIVTGSPKENAKTKLVITVTNTMAQDHQLESR